MSAVKFAAIMMILEGILVLAYGSFSYTKETHDAGQVDELEQKVDATKVKLKELGEASDDAWEQLKVGVEAAWGALSAAIRNAAAKFKD